MSDFKEMIREMSRSKDDIENDVINELAELILKHIKNKIKERASTGLYALKGENRIISGICVLRYSDDNIEEGECPFYASEVSKDSGGYAHFRGHNDVVSNVRTYKGIHFRHIDVNLLSPEPTKSEYGDVTDKIFDNICIVNGMPCSLELCVSELELKLRKRIYALATINEIEIKSYFLVSKCKKGDITELRKITSETFKENKVIVTQEEGYYVYFDVVYQYEFEF